MARKHRFVLAILTDQNEKRVIVALFLLYGTYPSTYVRDAISTPRIYDLIFWYVLYSYVQSLEAPSRGTIALL